MPWQPPALHEALALSKPPVSGLIGLRLFGVRVYGFRIERSVLKDLAQQIMGCPTKRPMPAFYKFENFEGSRRGGH